MDSLTFERQATERARILAELQSLAGSDDPEVAHVQADELLVEYLRMIGADDIADAFQATPRWYG